MTEIPTVFQGVDRPGFSVERLVYLMRRAISEIGLDLTGVTVLTEAATGAYAVTPVIAALAGAPHVYCRARSSKYGSVPEVTAWIKALSRAAGVSHLIQVIEDVTPSVLSEADIVTNSGHLRPITSDMIGHLPEGAVIALMYEAWEIRSDDVDIAACFRRGIPVVGVNECHPSIDVFSFLGPLSVRQLHNAGLEGLHNRIAVVCDNAFAEPLHRGLSGLGADVDAFEDVFSLPAKSWDAILISLTPKQEPRVAEAEAKHLASIAEPHTVIMQFFGDIDRDAAAAQGLRMWPPEPPALGHMGILLPEIGPEPIVRLQTGGLRAAEWVWRGKQETRTGYSQTVLHEETSP